VPTEYALHVSKHIYIVDLYISCTHPRLAQKKQTPSPHRRHMSDRGRCAPLMVGQHTADGSAAVWRLAAQIVSYCLTLHLLAPRPHDSDGLRASMLSSLAQRGYKEAAYEPSTTGTAPRVNWTMMTVMLSRPAPLSACRLGAMHLQWSQQLMIIIVDGMDYRVANPQRPFWCTESVGQRLESRGSSRFYASHVSHRSAATVGSDLPDSSPMRTMLTACADTSQL